MPIDQCSRPEAVAGLLYTFNPRRLQSPTPNRPCDSSLQDQMAAMRDDLASKASELDAWEAEKSRYQANLATSHARIHSLAQTQAGLEYELAELRAASCADREASEPHSPFHHPNPSCLVRRGPSPA